MCCLHTKSTILFSIIYLATYSIFGHESMKRRNQMMRKINCSIMVIILVLSAAACTAPASVQSPAVAQSPEAVQSPDPSPGPESVIFNDSALEAKVRSAMNKPAGSITAEEAETLTKLDLSNEWQQDMPDGIMIKNISALKYFKNLKELKINNNAVADISTLAQLKRLVLLELRGNKISDLSPLADLEELSYLHLQINQITGISPLAGLKNLKGVWLEGNTITDYSPLKDIAKNLEQKDFEIVSADEVSDDPIIIADPKLESALRRVLGIQDGPVTQKDAYRIQSLDLHQSVPSDEAFTDISALSYFKNLSELYLDGNRINDLSPVSGLTKLKVLTFASNQVTDISGLAGLTQLEKLDAKTNKIVDVSPLTDLTNVWELQLNSNQITDISPLANLKNLRVLLLNDNPVTDFSFLRDIYPSLEGKDFDLK